MKNNRLALASLLAASLLSLSPASAQDKVLRIAMTASDIPTTTGMPNNGFEGMRFLGFPIFEGHDPVRPHQVRPARHPAAGPGRKMGTGAGRQEDLDLPSQEGREVP